MRIGFWAVLPKGFQDELPKQAQGLLGGSWDFVTTYSWAYNPTYNPPKWPYRGYPNYKQGYNPSYNKYLLSPMNLQVGRPHTLVGGALSMAGCFFWEALRGGPNLRASSANEFGDQTTWPAGAATPEAQGFSGNTIEWLTKWEH